MSLLIGLDISDGHVTAALVRVLEGSSSIENDLLYTRPYRLLRNNDPRAMISTWIDCLHDLLRDLAPHYSENDRLLGLACGIPGPMDYAQGVCLSQSSALARCYGLNLRHALRNGLANLQSRWPATPPSPVVNEKKEKVLPTTKNLSEFCGSFDDDGYLSETESVRSAVVELPLPKISSPSRSLIESLSDLPISFYNETTSFAVGEMLSIRHEDRQRILALTLGRRFGSTFIDRGEVRREEILRTHSDEWFSSEGLIRLYQKILADHSPFPSRSTITGQDLAERASHGDLNARLTFRTFARLLGEFLVPQVKEFRVQLIVIGGGLAQAWYLFEEELKAILAKSSDVEVYFSLSHDRSICLGAAQQCLSELSATNVEHFVRRTDQNLLPVVKTIETSDYDLYPSHRLPIGQIGVGHRALHERLVHLIEESRILLVDGHVGVDFDEYAEELLKIYREHSDTRVILIYETRVFRGVEIDQEKLTYLRKNLSTPCVVIGPGASFVSETSPLIYIDLAKNELYYRIAAKNSLSDTSMLNKLQQDLLPRLTFFVDGQRPRCPTWLDGETFRQALAHLVNEPIRARPWFESGPSGGQWLKSVCKNLSQQSKNYAHSFELVPGENGVILSDDRGRLVEFSWDLLYASQTSRILGNDTHCRLFSSENDFPLRFDLRERIDRHDLQGITHYILHNNIDEDDVCRSQVILQISATSDRHIYEVHRLIIEPDETVTIPRSTENRFQLCMLVEGDAIEIQFDRDQRRRYNSLETFLLPASIGDYRLRAIVKSPSRERPFVLLLVCLRWNCDQLTSQLDE